MAMPAAPDATTRERILDAALDLFAANGFAGTSMRQLAGAVDLRESSLYNHFPSKEALYTALVQARGPAGVTERLRSPAFLALRDDPATFCRTFADSLLDQWCDPREQKFLALMIVERNRLPMERARFFQTLFGAEANVFTGFFRQFVMEGLITTSDARETARQFMAGLTFIRLEYFILPPEPGRREHAREAIDRFLDHFLTTIGVESTE